MSRTTPLVVIDDDPTGTQAMAGVKVLLRFDRAAMTEVAGSTTPAVHLMTNSRAEQPAVAREMVTSACRTAAEVWPGAEIVLRGDSTLRGHVLEEYEAVRDVRFPGQDPVLLLAPALPDAGRVTLGGVHLLRGPSGDTPLDRTEYARDPVLGYHDARLLAWAEERSRGWFPAADGAHVPLGELRARGSAAVVATLRRLAEGGPNVCTTDAENLEDLRMVSDAFLDARRAGIPVILRCAPTMAGLASGATATGFAVLPSADDRGILVVCGSFVPLASRQLAEVAATFPEAMVEPDLAQLVDPTGSAVEAIATDLDERLERGGLAVLASPRPDPSGPGGLGPQAAVASTLAAVVAALRRPPAVVMTKGGVTSAVTVASGLGAAVADVDGPVVSGVSRWEVSSRGEPVSCLVVPGNVGDDHLLLQLTVGLVGAAGRERWHGG